MRYSIHLVVVSFFLGTSAALLLGGQQALSRAEDSLRNSLVVSAYLQSSMTGDQEQRFQELLRRTDPEIQSLTYVSKDQAYQEALKDPALAKSLMILRNNPLPASYLLRYKDTAWTRRSDPAALLRGLPEIQEIRWDAEARSVFLSIHEWRMWLNRFAAGAGILLGMWAFVGLYRFMSVTHSWPDLARQLSLGGLGGAIALGAWTLAVQRIGAEASRYQPSSFTFVPLLAGILTALACYSWSQSRE